MRKLFIVSILLLAKTTSAQVTNTVTLEWSPNPTADAILSYNLYVDTNPPISIAPDIVTTGCQLSPCVTTTITMIVGKHSVKVTAVNNKLEDDPTNPPGSVITTTQESLPSSTVTFKVNTPPGKVTNVKIKR